MLRTFRRLRWRMTCSYVLVTIPAMVLIQTCFLLLVGGAFYAFVNSQALAEEQATKLASLAPQAVAYMRGPVPDQAGLASWLRSTTCDGKDEPSMFPDDTHPPVLLAAVVDPSGQVIAATGGPGLGGRLADQLDPQGTQVLQAALSGQTAPELLALRQPSNALIAATPIKDADQRVLGAWFVHVAETTFFTSEEALIVVLVFLVPISILATGFALILGSIYGHLTSRNLVRRLRTLAAAADDWSAGDLRPIAPDRSEDELGTLSRRLNQMAAQLRTLVATRQELAAIEERNRLARDLHDSVKQQLFAISMQLASARTLLQGQAPVDTMLAHAEASTQAAQQEVMATIHALRPAALGDAGLIEAVRSYVITWSEQHGIRAEISCRSQRELPPAIEQSLLRVVQEALANIARHSAATQLTIQLSVDPQAFSMTIADDGRGFDPQASEHHGLGLQSIRERMAACGGSLTITSRPGAGTCLSLSVPLKEQHHA